MEQTLMGQKETVIAHLKEHGTINQKEALDSYGIRNLRNEIGYLKREGHNIDTIHGGTAKAYYILRDRRHKKLLDVPEDIHAAVKRLALESTLNGDPKLEKDIYVEAIRLGLEKLT